MKFQTFKATFVYKGGAIVTRDGFLNLSSANGHTELTWETGGPEKILKVGMDDLAAIHYTINPWYKNLWFALWRLFN